MSPEQLTVVYHCCCGWDWAPVVRWQLDHLSGVGLRRVLCTHLGPPESRTWLQEEAVKRGIHLLIESSDPNIAHYETHAMLLIERLARVNDGAVMYVHTKGVSCPGSDVHRRWRLLLHSQVIEHWRDHLASMDDHDVCGVGWGYNFSAPHFPGNFWLARMDWIRRLPSFAPYHGRLGLTRFTCETWIGSAPGPRVKSLLCENLGWNEILARFMP